MSAVSRAPRPPRYALGLARLVATVTTPANLCEVMRALCVYRAAQMSLRVECPMH